jgi:hypothetical protein
MFQSVSFRQIQRVPLTNMFGFDFSTRRTITQVRFSVCLGAHGHRLVRDLTKVAARHVIEEIGATRPGMANLTRSVLSKVITYAIETGLRADNPFSGLKPYRLGTYHTWTDAEIAQFERRWPLGTANGMEKK